ncbi:glycoside hydrolase family 16 protein [Nocardioides panacisoli]|uniref:GH16 domain-containing protein n=1 Tax=Nocardioides panacisoli TaxID=627624 RepID=A0ABP7IR75_9ACTN
MPRIVPVFRRALAGIAVLAVASLVPPAITDAPAAATPRKADACGAAVPKKGGAQWTCTFVDDFKGTALDKSKWTVQHTADTGFRTERTCYQDDPSNVEVRDGTLVLTARKGRWVNCRFRSRWMSTRFTGGMVGTRDTFTQAYGRFEVRARFPDTDRAGLHGGFWMYPPDETYGDWPSSGEIDVAEWWSYEPTLALPSLHFDTDDPDVDSGWECRVDDASVFHTYTLVWEPTSIRFLIDGSTCFSRLPTPDAPLVAPQPFDRPFGMILNMGVAMNGLSWRTQFPASLVVDYAKAWR